VGDGGADDAPHARAETAAGDGAPLSGVNSRTLGIIGYRPHLNRELDFRNDMLETNQLKKTTARKKIVPG
jgi:hypothetical protein